MSEVTPDSRAIAYAKHQRQEPWLKPSEIRAARAKTGLSRARAAALVNYSGSMWQMWEDGKRGMPLEAWRQFLSLAGQLTADDSQDVGKERQLWAAHFASLKALEMYYANKRTMDAKRRHAELL